jgi:hypothetical protein
LVKKLVTSRLDEDFKNFNLDIERITEEEITEIRQEINALKDKANKMGEAALNPFPNEEKRS